LTRKDLLQILTN